MSQTPDNVNKPSQETKTSDMVAEIKKRKGQEIKTWYEQLASPDAQEFARLPEAVFVANFLPLFAGQSVPKHINLAAWVSIAGTPYKPVHVVGQDQSILYTIPPLFDREATKPDLPNRQTATLANAMTTYSQLLSVHPVQAQRYLENEFDKRQLMQNIPGAVVNHLKVWNDIFTRYNLPLIAPEITSQTPEKIERNQWSYDDDIL